jgi:hypothetical protein
MVLRGIAQASAFCFGSDMETPGSTIGAASHSLSRSQKKTDGPARPFKSLHPVMPMIGQYAWSSANIFRCRHLLPSYRA